MRGGKLAATGLVLLATLTGCSFIQTLLGGSKIAVSGVTISKTNTTILVGASELLAATVAPSNASNKGISWDSSNSSVAMVTSSGLVSGVAQGSAMVTVTTNDGARTASCTVTVNAATVAVTGIALSKTTDSILVGASDQLTATLSPVGATDQGVAWSTTNAAVATVSTSGLVTGVAAGSANVLATSHDGAFTAICNVTVTSPPMTMTVSGTIYDGVSSQGLQGVTVHLGTNSTTTAANGSYSLSYTSSGGTADFGAALAGYYGIAYVAAPMSAGAVTSNLVLGKIGSTAGYATHTVTGRIYSSGSTEIADMTSGLSILIYANGVRKSWNGAYNSAAGGYSLPSEVFGPDCLVIATWGSGPNYAFAGSANLSAATTNLNLTQATPTSFNLSGGITNDTYTFVGKSPYGLITLAYGSIPAGTATASISNPLNWPVYSTTMRNVANAPVSGAGTIYIASSGAGSTPTAGSTYTLPAQDTTLSFTSSPAATPTVTYATATGLLSLEGAAGANLYYGQIAAGPTAGTTTVGFILMTPTASTTLPSWVASVLAGNTGGVLYLPLHMPAGSNLGIGVLGIVGGTVPPNFSLGEIMKTSGGGNFFTATGIGY